MKANTIEALIKLCNALESYVISENKYRLLKTETDDVQVAASQLKLALNSEKIES